MQNLTFWLFRENTPCTAPSSSRARSFSVFSPLSPYSLQYSCPRPSATTTVLVSISRPSQLVSPAGLSLDHPHQVGPPDGQVSSLSSNPHLELQPGLDQGPQYLGGMVPWPFAGTSLRFLIAHPAVATAYCLEPLRPAKRLCTR